jgi:hypothetical protein
MVDEMEGRPDFSHRWTQMVTDFKQSFFSENGYIRLHSATIASPGLNHQDAKHGFSVSRVQVQDQENFFSEIA